MNADPPDDGTPPEPAAPPESAPLPAVDDADFLDEEQTAAGMASPLIFDPADDPGLGSGGARPPESEAAPGGDTVPPPPIPEAARLPSILESLLLAADRPLASVELAAYVGEPDAATVETALQEIAAAWEPSGIHVHHVGGGWQLRTNPKNAPWVQKLLAQKPVRLTRSQLETLAIVGYRQPITRPEIDDIRGVDSGGTLKTLLDRSLVRVLGKKEEPGRPLLYGTTKDFLEFFNLHDLKDLPTLREFHELSEEHRAQVAALEGQARPGTVDPPGTPEPPPPPLQRVDLADAPEEDMAQIDQLIDGAGAKAQAAATAIAEDGKPPEAPPGEAPAHASPVTKDVT